jgi:cytochrome c biogenesis protein CcdA
VTPVRVSATSSSETPVDEMKRQLAWDVLKQSNDSVLGFSKLMVPTSLSAVGAIVALGEYIGADSTLVGVAAVLMLLAALLFAHSVYARPVRVSLDDYDDVVDELVAAALRRRQETTWALALLAVAVVVAIVALVA